MFQIQCIYKISFGLQPFFPLMPRGKFSNLLTVADSQERPKWKVAVSGKLGIVKKQPSTFNGQIIFHTARHSTKIWESVGQVAHYDRTQPPFHLIATRRVDGPDVLSPGSAVATRSPTMCALQIISTHQSTLWLNQAVKIGPPKRRIQDYRLMGRNRNIKLDFEDKPKIFLFKFLKLS